MIDSFSTTELIVAGAGLGSLIAYIALIARPAWSAYSSLWQRFAALFLSLYVLAAFVTVGAIVGFAVWWSSDSFL